ncbi:MAG: RraA family protein [Pseudomonadota bacterium]
MIEEPPLLQIRRPARRPTEGQIAALRHQPTGFLCDALGGKAAFPAHISLLDVVNLPTRFCGVAITSNNGPDDLLGLMASLSLMQPGDVAVAATGNWRGSAVTGDRVLGMMKNSGVVGFVTDGMVRDHEGIVEVGLPVVCAGMTPNSPFTKGPGIVGEPVSIGGVSVQTGDLIVADRTGTVVVPIDSLEEEISTIDRITGLEEEMDAKVAGGMKVPSAIEELLSGERVTWLG